MDQKPNADDLRDHVIALETLMSVCLKEIRNLHAHVAALRGFVYRAEPFSADEWEQAYADGLSVFDDQVRSVLASAAATHGDAMLRRLLETHDSKPQ